MREDALAVSDVLVVDPAFESDVEGEPFEEVPAVVDGDEAGADKTVGTGIDGTATDAD